MTSDFDLLSQKVDELARLAHALRRENAGLRANLAMASAEKDELARRMHLAQQRVAAMLARLPGGADWGAAEDDGSDDGLDAAAKADADAEADGDATAARLAEMP